MENTVSDQHLENKLTSTIKISRSEFICFCCERFDFAVSEFSFAVTELYKRDCWMTAAWLQRTLQPTLVQIQSKGSLTMSPIPAKCLLINCRMVAKDLQVTIKSNCSPLAAYRTGIHENYVYPQNGALFLAPTTETIPLVTRAMRHQVLKWARLFFIFFCGGRLPVFMLIVGVPPIMTFFARGRSTAGPMTCCKWRRTNCWWVKCALLT